VTILERIRGPRRPVEIGRIARNIISRDVHALGRDAADVLDQVNDIRVAAVDAIEQFQSIAAQAGEKAGDAVAQLGDGASRTAKDLSKVKDLRIESIKLEGTGDDIVGRLKEALPTERISSLVENLERELPTTDKGRYDRAYSRGWARARTSFVVVGALTGIIAGIAGAYLFDPRHGSQRRDMITTRVRRTTKDATRQASRAARLTTDRARGFAVERGLIKPGNGDASTGPVSAGLVGVMDPASTGGDNGHATSTEGVSMDGGAEPVMPFADGPITDSSSTEREPMAAPEGGYLGGVPAATDAETVPGDGATEGAPMASGDTGDTVLSANANAVTSTLEPNAEDATITGEDSDRGTWHRTL
jgi:hypothetical protein